MSDDTDYRGSAMECLGKYDAYVGDSVAIIADLTYSGIVMPANPGSADDKIVLKLGSGYNVSISVDIIQDIQSISIPEIERQIDYRKTVETGSKELERKLARNEPTKKILLLGTGGTISSNVDYRTGGVAPALTAAEILKQVPEMKKIAEIDAEVLFSEHSENLQPEHWIKIAEKLHSLVDSDYNGILILHGTDTMHYTSSFLSFALAGFPKPVALVGSQRSPDRPSSDGPQNLIAASKLLVRDNTKGIFLVMHHNNKDHTVACHLGTRVRKEHTSKREAFETVGGNPAFIVTPNWGPRNNPDESEGLEIFPNMKNGFFKDEEYNPRIKIDTKVTLVKYHPGYDPKLIENLIQTGCKAIIFEGTGLGHVGRTMYDVIKNAKENDLFLGMTSQCIDGRINMNVYESGRDLLELGITPLENMTPETSLVKAMWALGNSKDVSEMEELMLKEIASEF